VTVDETELELLWPAALGGAVFPMNGTFDRLELSATGARRDALAIAAGVEGPLSGGILLALVQAVTKAVAVNNGMIDHFTNGFTRLMLESVLHRMAH
jgi:hypothetical protein